MCHFTSENVGAPDGGKFCLGRISDLPRSPKSNSNSLFDRPLLLGDLVKSHAKSNRLLAIV